MTRKVQVGDIYVCEYSECYIISIKNRIATFLEVSNMDGSYRILNFGIGYFDGKYFRGKSKVNIKELFEPILEKINDR